MDLPVSLWPTLMSEMGVRWILFRLGYAAQLKFGILRRRNPAHSWDRERQVHFTGDIPEKLQGWRNSHSFFFCGIQPSLAEVAAKQFPGAAAEAEQVLAGKWMYFQMLPIQTGFPPEWNRNPATGKLALINRHWSSISEHEHGDIKLIWEASRFSPVYALARAYAVTGDERYAEGFWTLFEDWMTENPPHRGPNWGCGQEAAIRVMAWYFGLHAFAGSPSTSKERVSKLTLNVAVHGTRIERNIGYALSQNNNHGLSEAVGLWTIGVLSPELRDAKRWRQKGRALIEKITREQIYADGSYIQHSSNYHRLMLHDLIWAMRLGELNSERFSDGLYDKVARAVDFLAALVDADSGEAPNYGSNDGACILPLNSCGFQDFRPVLQLANFTVRRRFLYARGRWDEDILWLYGADALKQSEKTEAHVQATAQTLTGSGHYSMHGPESRGIVTCNPYHHRPSQADQLHFDLWWRGQNIARDPGTYLYSGAQPWDNSLARTSVHNTVLVDGRDQMLRVGRFLWLKWAQGEAKVLKHGVAGHIDLWEGQHDGYRSFNVIHRRAIVRHCDTWMIVDDITGTGRHTAVLHWSLADVPYRMQQAGHELTLNTRKGALMLSIWSSHSLQLRVIRAGHKLFGSGEDGWDEIRGWYSPSYACKVPGLSLVAQADSELPLRFVSFFRPAEASCDWNGRRVQLTSATGVTSFELSAPGESPIVRL